MNIMIQIIMIIHIMIKIQITTAINTIKFYAEWYFIRPSESL